MSKNLPPIALSLYCSRKKLQNTLLLTLFLQNSLSQPFLYQPALASLHAATQAQVAQPLLAAASNQGQRKVINKRWEEKQQAQREQVALRAKEVAMKKQARVKGRRAHQEGRGRVASMAHTQKKELNADPDLDARRAQPKFTSVVTTLFTGLLVCAAIIIGVVARKGSNTAPETTST